MTKLCKICKESKQLSEFYKQKSTKDGLQSHCKKCDNTRKTEYLRKKNPPTRQPTLVARELFKQGLKRCPRCQETKPLDSFYESGKSNGGYASQCIICCSKIDKKEYSKKSYQRNKDKARNWKMKKKFGITLEEYKAMSINQDHKCAVCKRPETSNKLLAIDHNHETGRIRGLLCGRCNPALGFLKENPEIIRQLIQYLESYNGVPSFK